jgi:PAS domain S-box-containing protein
VTDALSPPESERESASRQLLDEATLRALIEQIPLTVYIDRLDDTSSNAYTSPQLESILGYSVEEWASDEDLFAEVLHPDDRDQVMAEHLRTRETGEPFRMEYRMIGRDGSVHWFLDEATVIRDDTGRPAYHHGFLLDITARKELEDALRRGQEELREQTSYAESLLETSPTAIATVDLDGKITSWNWAAEELFGYARGEAVGRELDELVANNEDDDVEVVGYEEILRTGRYRALTRRNRKDGTFVDVELIAVPIVVEGEPTGYLVIYHDITALKQAEAAQRTSMQELQGQKEHYQALLELSPTAIIAVDLADNVTSWNSAAEELFGYTQEEAVGRNIDSLVAKSDELLAEAVEINRQTEKGKVVHLITRRNHKDGSLVDVDVRASPIVVNGEIVGLYALYHDIRELQRARQQAEAATHAKSAFLATMSHEIRTPMNAVIGMTGLLLDTELTSEQRNFAEVIRSSGDALLAVINDILDFSKIEAGRLEMESRPFDLRSCLEDALELVAASASNKGLDLAYLLDPQTPGALVGDVTRLRQILINLLNNAVKFTEEGEVVLSVTAAPSASSARPTAGRHRIHFAVRDTGIGIPEDRMNRLFESFTQVDASTTRRYGGTGLGLAISKRLSEMMGGTMWVDSRVGAGSTFHFTIGADAAPSSINAYERGVLPQLAGKRILIVDDNSTNRRILVRQAESWGMLSRETGRPEEALVWIRRADPFDVAILDMQMPEMDGLTLGAEIRRHRSAEDLPLVMLTSLGRLEEKQEGVEFAAHLTKPIKPSQLYDALMEVFGAASAQVAGWARPVAYAGDMAVRMPLRILVAEDNTVNQQLAALLLKKIGYRADIVGNGLEALEALERRTYDVVLMDVQMPEMDGLEASRRMHRQWPKGKRPRIIAVTANALAEERETCLAAGMDDYVSKPIRMDKLVTALGRCRPVADATPLTMPAAGPSSQRGVEAGAPKAATIDAETLRGLRATLGDDPAIVADLIDTFLAAAPKLVAGARQAATDGNVEEVRRTAHTLKSNGATFGATTLFELCRGLEAMGKTGKLEEAQRLVAQIETEYERVGQVLESVRTELRNE